MSQPIPQGHDQLRVLLLQAVEGGVGSQADGLVGDRPLGRSEYFAINCNDLYI